MASVKPRSFISYKSAETYFTFSFVFDFHAPYYCIVRHLCRAEGWTQGIPFDRQGKPPFLLIKKRSAPLSEASREYIATCIHKELHTARNVVLQYGRFDGNENIVLDEFPVELQSLIRLADNGSGCVTYRITTTSDTDFRTIYKVLSLSQRQQGGRDCESSRLVVNDSVKRLYDLFAQDLFAVERDINGDIDTSLCSDVNLPAEHLVQLEDKEIMDFGDPLHGESRTPTQNPYVLIVLEIDAEPNGKMFWDQSNLKEKSTQDKHRELTALLLRLVFPPESLNDGLKFSLSRTRLPCELQNTNGGLKNYSWDSRILTCFSRVSTLFACMDKLAEPEQLLRNSLLDTVEILRSRWHMSILLNALLDHDMEYIKGYASSDNLEALERLIRRRKQFAYFLDDPLTYNFEGGSITRIVDVAESEMWLAKLQELTFKKLTILDSLYEDQMKYIRTKELQKLQSELSTDLDSD